jgi:magnesium chelatase subunit I
MKLALLLSIIDPNIGGVVLMGHRGTAKSTAVRGLAQLLPTVVRVRGCLYGCDPSRIEELCSECSARLSREGRLPRERSAVPVVDLPLGATEDRVCGTIDIERALVEGVKAFEPGLLARANRGFLYVDEVNLLDDHLVDVLLDVAASGRNVVEREGISLGHPARFVLVGSGNPEEGELRPQLLDRFGLFAEIATITDTDQRVKIIEHRERFESDRAAFILEFAREQQRLRSRLARAKRSLEGVAVDRTLLRKIAELCVKLGVDGHRGELTIMRAARAVAAFEGKKAASELEVRRVVLMSLRHRLRRSPLGAIDGGNRIEEALDAVLPDQRSSKLVAIG